MPGILLPPDIRESKLWEPDRPRTKLEAWIDLSLLAQTETTISERKLAERWKWPKTKVHKFINELREADHILDQKRTALRLTELALCEIARTKNGPQNGPPKKPPREEDLDTVPYQKVVDLYNGICISFPSVTLTEKRKPHIAARFKQFNGSFETFHTLFTKTEQSDFLKGKNDRNWKADFDWLIKNDSNPAKVIEGKYDNRGQDLFHDPPH